MVDLDQADATLEGALFGDRYVLEKQIGAGGFACVFQARDRRLHRHVAIKVLDRLKMNSLTDVRRFRNEAGIGGSLDDEHIAKVYDYGEHGRYFYFVMELLRGRSLRDVLWTREPLPWPRAAELAELICVAVERAHEHHIVHRDIKPENLFLEVRRGVELIKVLDLGIAKVLQDDQWEWLAKNLSMTNDFIGSPSYMAPEQTKGPLHCDLRVDIYAVGVVLYEMLTGAVPFRGETPWETLMMHTEKAPEPLGRRVPGLVVPEALEAHVFRALAKDPGERFQKIGEMAAALHEIVAGAPAALKGPRAFVPSKQPEEPAPRDLPSTSTGQALPQAPRQPPAGVDAAPMASCITPVGEAPRAGKPRAEEPVIIPNAPPNALYSAVLETYIITPSPDGPGPVTVAPLPFSIEPEPVAPVVDTPIPFVRAPTEPAPAFPTRVPTLSQIIRPLEVDTSGVNTSVASSTLSDSPQSPAPHTPPPVPPTLPAEAGAPMAWPHGFIRPLRVRTRFFLGYLTLGSFTATSMVSVLVLLTVKPGILDRLAEGRRIQMMHEEARAMRSARPPARAPARAPARPEVAPLPPGPVIDSPPPPPGEVEPAKPPPVRVATPRPRPRPSDDSLLPVRKPTMAVIARRASTVIREACKITPFSPTTEASVELLFRVETDTGIVRTVSAEGELPPLRQPDCVKDRARALVASFAGAADLRAEYRHTYTVVR